MTSATSKGSNWFALQVRARWESSTATQLSGKGYPVLLPTRRTKNRNRTSTRTNPPLFPGYIFCEFDALNRLPILVTPGVIAVVSSGRVPMPVSDAEIAAIQTIISSGASAEPWPFLEVGNKVRFESGALRGLTGILIHVKGNHRIVVSVSLLRRSVAVEIDRECVSAFSSPNASPEPFVSQRLSSASLA
jgi:transcriptional antiterminator NusG